MTWNLVGKLAAASAMAALVVGAWAAPVLAEGLVDASDSPRIEAGREVDGTAWLAGNNISVAGTVRGDLFCAGNTITITGVVEGDVLCAGSNVTVTGEVRGDVRLAGQSVTVGGSTGGAATLAGNSVSLAASSSVGSDLSAAAATIDLAGSVVRDARLGAGSLTISGRVGRDVDAEADRLTVTPDAAIGGHLHYVSAREASVSPGTVQGEVRRTEPPPRTEPPATRPPGMGAWWLGALAGLVGLVVLSLAVVLLLPRFVRRATDTSWSGVGKAAVVGLVTLAAILPMIVILFVTVVGAGAGVLLMVAFPLALLVAAPLTAYYVGRELLRRRTDNMLAMVALGAALLGLVGLIPFVGFLVGLAAVCVGLGFIVLDLRYQYDTRRYTDPGRPAPPTAPENPVAPDHPGATG